MFDTKNICWIFFFFVTAAASLQILCAGSCKHEIDLIKCYPVHPWYLRGGDLSKTKNKYCTGRNRLARVSNDIFVVSKIAIYKLYLE